MQRVEVNEPTADELVNPTLEEELEMQEKARENKNTTEEEKAPEETPEEANTTEEEEVIEERPEWLPEKFKSPEDLAKAYENLEKKQGEQNTDTPEESTEENTSDNQPTTELVTSAIQQASESFYESGELTDKNYEDLEKAGISREVADDYMEGKRASNTARETEVQNTVGGKDNYASMIDWAGDSLAKDEVEAFNEIVDYGSQEAKKMAVKGLYARYMSEDGGSSVNIAKGATSGSTIQPFGSMAQVTTAMKDKRYQQDPSFRREVEQRISVSNL